MWVWGFFLSLTLELITEKKVCTWSQIIPIKFVLDEQIKKGTTFLPMKNFFINVSSTRSTITLCSSASSGAFLQERPAGEKAEITENSKSRKYYLL